MAIELPEWLEENFVNVENLMIDLFTKVFPKYTSGCWTPDDWFNKEVEPDPLLLFFRLPGGRVDWEQRKDQCFIQTMIVTDTRDDSWALMNGVRSILLPMSGEKVKMSDGYTAQIHGAKEVAGPQLLTPGQQIDTRVVTAVFEMSVSMKTAKNYKQFLAAL